MISPKFRSKSLPFSSDGGFQYRTWNVGTSYTTEAFHFRIHDAGLASPSVVVEYATSNVRLATNLAVKASSFGTSADGVIVVGSGTAPSTSPADAWQMYSADAAAGNACPHIRTENGSIIKLYKTGTYTPTNVLADRAYDANSTSTDELADVLGTLIADLQLLGIIG